MRRVTLLIATLLLSVGIASLPGCSDSDVTSPVTGDTTSPEFQFVQQFVGGDATEGVGKSVDISFFLLDSIPGFIPAPKGNFGYQSLAVTNEAIFIDSFNYAYTGGWHIFSFWGYVADTVAGDTVDISGIDSLQTLSNGMAMQIPDSTLDELKARVHFAISERGGTITGNADHSLDIVNLTPELLTPVTLNGSATETASGSFADTSLTCDFSFNNTLTITNVVAVLANDQCPSSGTIGATATVNIGCSGQIGTGIDTVAIQGTWSINAVFNNGNATVTYSDGTTVWQVTEPCDQPVAKPLAGWLPGKR